MKRVFLLLVLFILGTKSYGQSQLYLHLGMKPQPKDWLQIHDFNTIKLYEMMEFWPVMQADLGWRVPIGRSGWYWEGALSVRHTRQVLEFEREDFNPVQPDPTLDEAFNNGGITHSDELYYTGFKSGMVYQVSSNRGRQHFLTAIGLQAHLPTGCRRVSTLGKRENISPLYRGKDFEYGIYYGLYIRPSYEFALSGKRSNRWRIAVYLEGDLLIQQHSRLNPKYLWGGGLGVTYRLSRS